MVSYFSNSALESFRLKFKVNSKDNEPLCNVLCKYKECIRIYYMYTSDCSNRDGFARNTSSSYHTCKHNQSTLNQMNMYLIYHKNKKYLQTSFQTLSAMYTISFFMVSSMLKRTNSFYFQQFSTIFQPPSFVAFRVSFECLISYWHLPYTLVEQFSYPYWG